MNANVKNSKVAKAITIVNQNKEKGRQEIMTMLMNECGLSKHGANTYYYNIKNKRVTEAKHNRGASVTVHTKPTTKEVEPLVEPKKSSARVASIRKDNKVKMSDGSVGRVIAVNSRKDEVTVHVNGADLVTKLSLVSRA